MDRGRSRGLELEPFLQAGAAESMQTIEEGEGLVEQVCTYLGKT